MGVCKILWVHYGGMDGGMDGGMGVCMGAPCVAWAHCVIIFSICTLRRTQRAWCRG